jgi:Nickel responsive protein SCO4226-like
MKIVFKMLLMTVLTIGSLHLFAQKNTTNITGSKQLFMDVHRLAPGKVKLNDVAHAHAKDLAVQGKYGVQFLKYWVNEKEGLIFCLVSAADSEAIRQAHAEAHGLLPQRIYAVVPGTESTLTGNRNLFLDIHYLGPGKVSAQDVAGAHQKDLAVQKKYGVNLTNYWFDEKEGVVMCLAEAKDAAALTKTHKEAHGLVPNQVFKVTQGF